MEREKIADLVMSAHTWDECVAAEAALRAHLRAHPNDWALWDIGERLAMIKTLREEERAAAVPVSLPAVPLAERKVA